MADDKKTDKVISMTEFLKDESAPTGQEICDIVGDYNPKFVLVIHEDENGRLSLSTNYGSYTDIVFALEAVKASIIQQAMTQGY